MKRLLILSFILLIVNVNLFAGWKIIVHQNQDGIQDVITYYITKSGMKISTNDFDFVYFKSARKVVVVNHKTKSVFFGSFVEYNTQLADLMKINPKRADQILPKSFLLRFDELLAQNISDKQDDNIRTTPSLRIENANYNKRIANYEAVEYKIFFDTGLIEHLWLSQNIRVNSEFDILEAFNFFRGIKNTTLSQSKNMDTQEYEQLLLRGFPMKIVNMDNLGFEVYKYEVVQAEEIDIYEEEVFSPPKDYQARTLIDLVMAID